MKKLIIALSSVAILSLSATAMAGYDAEVIVTDSIIKQEQWGPELEQEAVIGLISNDFHGTAKIVVRNSKIVQEQDGKHSKQTASIGIVGCDCPGSKHGKH